MLYSDCIGPLGADETLGVVVPRACWSCEVATGGKNVPVTSGGCSARVLCVHMTYMPLAIPMAATGAGEKEPGVRYGL